jgi:hypothetical protein
MLAALALYGDLVKRALPGVPALIALYLSVGGVLIVILATGHAWRRVGGTSVSTLAGLLMAAYLAQLFTSFSADVATAVMAAAYICVPLALLFLIPRAYPEFDLRALALSTTILMVPIHIVGLIQRFIDPSFLISTTYSTESGGVVVRNLLEGGTFERFPSLFVSPDRYSGVAMMQIFLTFHLLAGTKLPTKRTLAWVIFSLLAGGASLLTAGARSRIVIVSTALLAASIVFSIALVRRRLTKRTSRRVMVVAVILATGLAVPFSILLTGQGTSAFPVVTALQQSIEIGDLNDRFLEGILLSQAPDNVTLFGEGLGSTAGGRPGEFAVRAMWIEGGLFWTLILLLIHASILFSLGNLALRAALSSNALSTLLAVGLGLAWLFALLAGLSSTFELSQALLLLPTIAVVSTMGLGAPAKTRVSPYSDAP